MSSPAEMSGWRSVLYQSFRHFIPTAHMLCLSRALSNSHLFPSSLLFLSLVLTLGPSGLCDTVLTLCLIGHLLQLSSSVSLSIPNTQIHTCTHNTSHNTHYLPDLISFGRLSLGLKSVTAHFSTDTVHPSSCPVFHITFLITTSQCHIKTKSVARVESLDRAF